MVRTRPRGTKLRCTECGKVTHENQPGNPVGDCPKRDGYATHTFEVSG